MWRIEISKRAFKTLQNLDSATQKLILSYLDERVAKLDNPKTHGKALVGKLKGLWRYRVGDYRIICRLEKETITILVLDIGHRRDIYK